MNPLILLEATPTEFIFSFLYLFIFFGYIYLYFYTWSDIIIQKESGWWIVCMIFFALPTVIFYYLLKISPRKYSDKYFVKCSNCKKRLVVDRDMKLKGAFLCLNCNTENNFNPNKRLRKVNLNSKWSPTPFEESKYKSNKEEVFSITEHFEKNNATQSISNVTLNTPESKKSKTFKLNPKKKKIFLFIVGGIILVFLSSYGGFALYDYIRELNRVSARVRIESSDIYCSYEIEYTIIDKDGQQITKKSNEKGLTLITFDDIKEVKVTVRRKSGDCKISYELSNKYKPVQKDEMSSRQTELKAEFNF